MKTALCHYSAFKIHPGHGIRFVRLDSKTFIFIGSKTEAAFKAKGNPRKCAWTAVYRRLHRKGTGNAAVKKKKARKANKVQRGIVGASLEAIAKRQAEKGEIAEKAKAAAVANAKKSKKAAPAKGKKAVKAKK